MLRVSSGGGRIANGDGQPAIAQRSDGRTADTVRGASSQWRSFEKSFNQSEYEGAERFKLETGIEYKETEVADHDEIETAFRNLMQQGATIIARIGFLYSPAIEKTAVEFPDI